MSLPGSTEAPGVLLPWDSDFFGFTIAQATDRRLTPESQERLLAWSRTAGVRCLYFSADAACGATLSLANDGGFKFVDLRVELAIELKSLAPAAPEGFRPARPDDWQPLEALSRLAYFDTRFWKDECFPRDRVPELYASWLKRDLREERVFVVSSPDGMAPTGYITCEVDAVHEIGRIGLIAVAKAQRGRGLGKALLQGALRGFAAAGCREVRVVTQGSNVVAQRLYQAAGFQTAEVSATYHRWF